MVKKLEIDGPLIFGNPEQIKKIRAYEKVIDDKNARRAFDEVPDCITCDGHGECSKCCGTCIDCDGIGKIPTFYRAFLEKYPDWENAQ